jgi:ABC-2 type transport system permease protein
MHATIRAILAIARKDIRLLLRDRSGFFFTFLFPVGFAIFFGIVFGGTGGSGGGKAQKIGVVLIDEDRTAQSKALADRLRTAEELDVESATDLAEAERAVLARKAAAYIHIPAGFGAKQADMLWGGQAQLRVGADPSRAAERGMLQGVLNKYAFMGMADTFTDRESTRKQVTRARELMRADKDLPAGDKLLFEGVFGAVDTLINRAERTPATAPGSGSASGAAPAFMPIDVRFADVKPKRTLPTSAFAISFPQGMIWGLMGAAMGFAASFVGERSGGTLMRLRAAPVPAWALMAGKGLACFITSLGVMGLMLVVSLFLGVRPPSWPMLAVAVVCVCFGFVGVMMLIAALAPTERAASGVGWAVMMVLAFIGGAAVPTFVMPGWMQGISNISPMRWAMLALEGGVWRDLGAADMALPLGIMLALGALGIGVGAWSLRRLS